MVNVSEGPQLVHYERTGQVVMLGIEAPPANALSADLVDALGRAIDQAVEDEISVLVIASRVPRFFVAGADIKLMQSGDSSVFSAYLRGVRSVIEQLPEAPFLSIAAIDGYALGGGLELAMACTLRIVSEDARLGVPEVKLGLLPGAGGTQRLPRLVGRSIALDLTMSGRSMAGTEAAGCGLADRLVSDPVGEAEEWAHELAQGPVEAYREIVRCIDAAAVDPDHGMQVEFDAVCSLFESEDGREGLQAFIEKRTPVFGQRSSGSGWDLET
jgi:enoyl-CoA hydratase/carnithine racemase